MKAMLLLGLIPSALFVGCDSDRYASGKLEISYTLNSAEAVVPSYQTVIWLEDEDGNYVKSLLVSEYISFGGFKDTTICPAWSVKANWAAQPQASLQAVTAATPKTQTNTLTVDCRRIKLLPGKYRYHVQTHIVENYNILYSGMITIEPGKTDRNTAKPLHTPQAHPKAATVLSDVKAKYY